MERSQRPYSIYKRYLTFFKGAWVYSVVSGTAETSPLHQSNPGCFRRIDSTVSKAAKPPNSARDYLYRFCTSGIFWLM